MPIKAPRRLTRYEEALRWFRERTRLSDDEFDQLLTDSRGKGFDVAATAKLRMVDRILKDARKAERKGESLEDFKKRTRRRLNREWGSSRGHAIDNIWRTEVQRQYQRGRHRQLTHQSVLNLRPFWIFDAVMDGVTSAICQERNGEIRHHSDTWWASNWPPLHHNCRSGVRSLRRSDIARIGGEVRRIPGENATPGFGLTPDSGQLTEHEADLTGTDDELRQLFERKRR